MSSNATAHAPDLTNVTIPRRPFLARVRGWIIALLLVGLLAWSWTPVEMYKSVSLITDWRNMAEFGSAFLKPNFHDWDIYALSMVETVQIAVWGTALAV
ncbi:MAG: hypothetical protein RLZ98_1987, partial [Pseudomonadota bacterium]